MGGVFIFGEMMKRARLSINGILYILRSCAGLLLCATALWFLGEEESSAAERVIAAVPPGYTVYHDQVLVLDRGEKLVYSARKDNLEYVIDGSTISKPYESTRHLAVSPDRKHVAFSGGKTEAQGNYYRVLDGIEIGPYTLICNPTFSPDSSKLAFEIKNGNSWRHALSEVGTSTLYLTPTADIHDMGPVFSSDGRFIASIQLYIAENRAFRVIRTVDLTEVYRREYERIGKTAYSSDKSRVAYLAWKKGKPLVVTSSFLGGDEKEGSTYDLIFGPLISPDGLHVAYGAERGGKRYLVIDGAETSAPLLLSVPVLSPDGEKAAYIADPNRRPFVVSGGREYPRFDGIASLVYSPDGKVIAYMARIDGKSALVIDEHICEGRYDYLDNILFSADGRNIAYRAERGGKKLMVITDRQGKVLLEGPPVEAIWEPTFVSTNRVGYAALSDREFWWKELTVK
jgi:hypothetical protein